MFFAKSRTLAAMIEGSLAGLARDAAAAGAVTNFVSGYPIGYTKATIDACLLLTR